MTLTSEDAYEALVLTVETLRALTQQLESLLCGPLPAQPSDLAFYDALYRVWVVAEDLRRREDNPSRLADSPPWYVYARD
ncbi:MAG TPA: hypothetical protein VE338_16630 [Ktedonobacterales bacterium]|jgi:hypothetical protein|nr:hypothetical protein [Ktedonobacterales bacterium]